MDCPAKALSMAMLLTLAGLAWAEPFDKAAAEKVAIADGRARLQEQVLKASLDKDWTVGALLKRIQKEQAMDSLLAGADMPGGVRWLDERTCQVKLQVSGAKTSETLIAAATAAADPQVDPRWVKQATTGWTDKAFIATGSNVQLPAVASADQSPAKAVLPEQPPRWVFGLADAEATARSGESGLKTARLAERQALAVLREQVRALELVPKTTLGSAADADPRIAKAVESALRSARVYKTEYRADGSVLVRMSLNLRLLWSELDATR